MSSNSKFKLTQEVLPNSPSGTILADIREHLFILLNFRLPTNNVCLIISFRNDNFCMSQLIIHSNTTG